MIVYLAADDLQGSLYHSGQITRAMAYDSNGEPILNYGETLEKPPIGGANEIALLNNETKKWTLSPNFIGIPYWNQDGTKAYVLYMGVSIPTGALITAPLHVYNNGHDGTTWSYKTNAEIAVIRKNEIRQKRKELFGAEVTVNGTAFEVSSKALSAMEGIVTETIINGLIDIEWEYPESTFTNYTVQDFKPIFKAIQGYRQACFKEHKRLLDVLTASTDPINEDLYAVYDGTNPGWPSTVLTA